MFDNLITLMNFDPMLIGVFAGLSMMTVQMLKPVSSWVDHNPMIVNMLLSVFFGIMVVLKINVVLETAVVTFLIMSAASGVYASSKKETHISLPDYSDSKVD